MGLVKKVICIGLITGSFFLGSHSCCRRDIKKEDVFNYVNSHKEDRKEIFLYSLEHLKRDDPDFLDSFTINTLNDKEKEEITKDYLKSKLRGTYEEGKKSLRDLSEKVYEFLSDPKINTP